MASLRELENSLHRQSSRNEDINLFARGDKVTTYMNIIVFNLNARHNFPVKQQLYVCLKQAQSFLPLTKQI